MTVDAGEHLGILRRVINQMNLEGDWAEEAYSEGLVAITVAAKKYDPSRNVPVAAWLARNIRWSITDWLNRAYQHADIDSLPIENPRNVLDSKTELNDVLILAEKILTPLERQIIMADAVGFSGREIARHLNLSPGWVSWTKTRGKEKLRKNFLEKG